MDKVAKSLMRPDPSVITTAPGEPPVGYAWLDKDHRTDVLTVWRTLWVERDQMVGKDQNGNDIPGSEVPLPDISLAQTEMAKACIDIKDASKFESKPNPQGQPEIQFVKLSDGTFDLSDIHDPSNGYYAGTYIPMNISYVCRDISVHDNTNSFWAIFAVGVTKARVINSPNDFLFGKYYREIFSSPGNPPYTTEIIMIFNDSIDQYAGTQSTIHLDNKGNPLVYRNASTLRRRIFLHETLHQFKFGESKDSNLMNYLTASFSEDSENILTLEMIKEIQKTACPTTLTR
jgi:hypothetical protein